MSQLKILTKQEIKVFDEPPLFTAEGRKGFFYITKHARSVLDSLLTPTNQVGFLLQLGYFKAVNKFFHPSEFLFSDLKYVQKKLNLSTEEIGLGDYNDTTYKRHRDIILKELGYKSYESKKKLFKLEAVSLCQKLVSPRNVFNELNLFLRWKKIEIPKYNSFVETITETLRIFEKSTLVKLNKHLNDSLKESFDNLLVKADETNDIIKLKRYRLTQLKKSNQSTRPLKIKENLDDLKFLEELFHKSRKLKKKLNLSDRLIEYYAQIVIKSQSQQTEHRKESKYLYLLSFVYFQYSQLNDIVIEQAMQSVQNVLNTGVRENRESFFIGREKRNQAISDTSRKANKYLVDIKKARAILIKKSVSDKEKVEELKILFSFESARDAKNLQIEFKKIAKEALDITQNADIDNMLEKKSVKLQNRASEVIKCIQFDEDFSDKYLIEAINYFKEKNGKLTSNAPVTFMKPEEKKKQFDSTGKFRISLYKSLLFKKVSEGVKSGSLSLKYSNKYRSFSDYLIPKERWDKEKLSILSRIGLEQASDFKTVIKKLKDIIAEQFKITNNNINNSHNKHVKIEVNGKLKVTTPRQKDSAEHETGLKNLFPQNRMISIYEVLAAVNKVANFTDSFEHWQIKNVQNKRPQNKTFFAGIIGYGCNLGTKKMIKISHRVNSSELENTVNWYFSNDNLISANDKVLELMDKLELPKEYRKNVKFIHTSSDGQKYDTGVESLNASFSFKFFGKNQGISIYGFIDESHRLFHSTVINPAEREAGYVIDGLLQNDVIKSDIHSTDTHGYSEIIFALTHLIGVSFAPRIKNLKQQQLYSFEKPSDLIKKGYNVVSKKMIHPEIIEQEWDNVLRLIATIKLKETTASQLLKRLSSYSKDHPLYRALKHFGRIIKTIFLLKYIDEVELRQMIEKQLNKIESANKMSKAVFFGNGSEFQVGAPNEQLITVGCKRLIENAIICWNYLYLSKYLKEITNKEKKKELLKLILNSSVVTWQHINFQGEYNFSDEYLKDTIEFLLPELLDILAA